MSRKILFLAIHYDTIYNGIYIVPAYTLENSCVYGDDFGSASPNPEGHSSSGM